MAISARLVTMMGGRIWVNSQVGQGSQFHFTATFGVAESRPVVPPASADLHNLAGIRVLVVDDNRTNRRILKETLARWEMRPTSVDSGMSALSELSAAHDAGDLTRWS